MVELEDAASKDGVGLTEEQVEVGVKEAVVMSKSNKEDLGKQSSVENLDNTEANRCGGNLRIGGGNGKKAATFFCVFHRICFSRC